MAHFAKLDKDNKVIEVHVVANAALDPQNEEESGIVFLTNWSDGHTKWKQTSYNGRIRKNYAGIGFLYDPIRDAFIAPKPFNSWVLNEESCKWEAPVEKPFGNYIWDESSLTWLEL